jgi:hypothetical protein
VITHFVGDTAEPFTDTMTYDDGTAVDLSDPNIDHVQIHVRPVDSDVDKVDAPMTVIAPGTAGKVKYPWLAGDVDTADLMAYWKQVVYTNGATLTSPADYINFILPGTVGAVIQPCQLWFEPGTWAECGSIAGAQRPIYAQLASELLYEWSGEMFSGACPAIVRPCRPECSCYQPVGVTGNMHVDSIIATLLGGIDCQPHCGCGIIPTVRIAGPVQAIQRVTIDGVTLDPATYRVVGESLERVDGLGWPACQDLLAENDAPGSFTVHYTRGATPPLAGELAAKQLACWLSQSFPGLSCGVPAGNVTQVIRQGVTQTFDPTKFGEQLPMVAAFLKTYNPNGLRQPPMVYTSDMAPYAR